MCTYAGIQAHSSSTTGQGKGGFGLIMGMVVDGLAGGVAGVGRVDGTGQVWGGEVTGARYLSCNTLMIISFWHTGAGIAIWRRDVDRRFVCLPRCGAGQLLWAAGCWLLAAGHLRAGGVLFCGGVLGVRRAGNGLTGVPVVWFGSGRIRGLWMSSTLGCWTRSGSTRRGTTGRRRRDGVHELPTTLAG
jgi:hypothetical protein